MTMRSRQYSLSMGCRAVRGGLVHASSSASASEASPWCCSQVETRLEKIESQAAGVAAAEVGSMGCGQAGRSRHDDEGLKKMLICGYDRCCEIVHCVIR
jgi:hypothetical protein